MTDHLLNNVEEQKQTFLVIVKNLVERSKSNIKSELSIPRDYNKARECFTEEKISTYDNVLHPEAHPVDGHVCVLIKEILKQTLALGVDIAWTYYPKTKTRMNIKEEQRRFMDARE